MKEINLTLVAVLLFSSALFSQGVIISEDENATSHESAILELESTDKGMLIPRMTETQRNAIGSPAEGLMIYQTDATPGFYFYNGTAWTFMTTQTEINTLEARIDALEFAQMKPTDIDGNTYEIVKIGNQIWMAEDLRVTTYSNGTAIPHVTDNTAWGNLGDNNTNDAYCFYDNNSSSDYGALYTYAAAMGDNAVSSNTNPSGVQGVCPDGWHLPSDAEWTELTDYLGGTSVAGGKMKETGTSHWNSPNTGATNESGFSALPGGLRYYTDGTFYYLGDNTSWWSASENSGSTAWKRGLFYANAEANRSNYGKSFGCSVRCVRD